VVAWRGTSDVLVVLGRIGALESACEGAIGEAHQARCGAVALPVCFVDERDGLILDVDAANGNIGVAQVAGEEFTVAWVDVVSGRTLLGGDL